MSNMSNIVYKDKTTGKILSQAEVVNRKFDDSIEIVKQINNKDVIQTEHKPIKTENTVKTLLTKLRNKNRKLSIDNLFLVDIINKDEQTGKIGKYSIYADDFKFQLFNLENEDFVIGFQNHNYLKNIKITNEFTLKLKENPDKSIQKLIYDYLFKLIKNNKTRIITDNNILFDEVYVYVFLDSIKKEKGNQFIYHFKQIKLNKLNATDFSLNYKGHNFIDRELSLYFQTVDIYYYDTNNKTYTKYSVDIDTGIFEFEDNISYVTDNTKQLQNQDLTSQYEAKQKAQAKAQYEAEQEAIAKKYKIHK